MRRRPSQRAGPAARCAGASQDTGVRPRSSTCLQRVILFMKAGKARKPMKSDSPHRSVCFGTVSGFSWLLYSSWIILEAALEKTLNANFFAICVIRSSLTV